MPNFFSGLYLSFLCSVCQHKKKKTLNTCMTTSKRSSHPHAKLLALSLCFLPQHREERITRASVMTLFGYTFSPYTRLNFRIFCLHFRNCNNIWSARATFGSLSSVNTGRRQPLTPHRRNHTHARSPYTPADSYSAFLSPHNTVVSDMNAWSFALSRLFCQQGLNQVLHKQLMSIKDWELTCTKSYGCLIFFVPLLVSHH